jgi:hypothetical protein
LPKVSSISLTKPVEATKLHSRTGLPLGLPEITIAYGSLIDYVGPDGDRERFTYLNELYACKREAYLAATSGAKSPPATVEETAPAPAQAAAPRLKWDQVNSSHYAVWRAAVPGGWLVTLNGGGVSFVPDPAHVWDGTSLE